MNAFERMRLGVGHDRMTTYWPPALEAYCRVCHRMVEARQYGAGPELIPVRHFRVDLSGQRSYRSCDGMYAPDPGSFRPGMEDPSAAFYRTVKERDKVRPADRWVW